MPLATTAKTGLRSIAWALVIMVGGCWALTWSLLALVLVISDVPNTTTIALTVAVAGTWLACWLCARVFSRSRPRWWLPVATLSGGASLGLAILFLRCLGLWPHELHGPTSPGGFATIIDVRDAGPGWSADFYCDVRILDATGNVVAGWKDREGQYPSDGPRLLRDSMRWTSPQALEFTTRFGAERINVP